MRCTTSPPRSWPTAAKRWEPERGYQADLIGGHDALAVLGVIGSSGRLCRAAVTPQVRQNDGVILRQGWCHLVPHHVGLGIAVQHQDRRS
jgi:hypothetical protein